MKTYIYLSRDGVKYAVFHRNASNKTWEHPFSDRSTCRACLGQSEAAPLEPIERR